MLELKDFFHLSQVETLVEELISDGPGLIVAAGLDPRPLSPPAAGGFLPSGRSALFGILIRRMLAARRGARAVVVAESKEAIRLPNYTRRQVELAWVKPPHTYVGLIDEAVARHPDLLIVDRLTAETAPAALQAAQSGLWVVSQMDTVFCGAGVARHLFELGVPRDLLAYLTGVIAVQRLATLCPNCKQPGQPDPALLDSLRRRYPALPADAMFFRAGRCENCNQTGRQGDVAAFDVFRAGPDPDGLFDYPSRLSIEEYVLHLAALGYVPLEDFARLGDDQLHRTYSLLAASERALSEANAALQRKLAELEAANRVLRQRTDALISLQDIGHTLITLTGLDDLAARVCRHARELCEADRAILYYLRPDGEAEVLSASGWDPELVHRRLEALEVFGAGGSDAAEAGGQTMPFAGQPPGVPYRSPDLEGAVLRAGLRVPLVAQHEVVGLMIVHSTRKARFAPGEVALIQAFADQAALAIQRTGLIEALQDKIDQLEAAQAELVKKERLERELELARQVQQSLLPRIFPLVPGYAFAAQSEPARRVGGDFYDVILLDADRFGVVVADVSDKGMPAALFMALTRSLMLAEARRERSPRAVLANVHRLLLELGRPNMFVTVFYGVIDAAARRLTYARAGQDRPLLQRDGQIRPLSGEGVPLGILDEDEMQLSEEELALAPGDRLVLYTDGLIDALDPGDRPFGLGRLTALIESYRAVPAADLLAAVFGSVATYQATAEQYDDMTLLVVDVSGRQE